MSACDDLLALAGPVRHEVNNLLGVRIGTIDLLARQAMTEREAARAARLRAAADRLGALIRAYLALAAPPPMPDGTDGAAVMAALRPLVLLLPGPEGEVEIAADANLPRLAMPPAELQAVLLAMAREAAAGTGPAGGLAIALRRAPGGAELSVTPRPAGPVPAPRRLPAAP